MFRARVRVKSGCFRCRVRRKKCDEKKPTCGFCMRWDLECSWSPTQTAHTRANERLCPSAVGSVSSAHATETKRESQEKEVVPLVNVGGTMLDPFHGLPIADAARRLSITGYLHYFFGNMIRGAMPFNIESSHAKLAHGWAQSVYGDVAVCHAFAGYCAHLQSQRSIGKQHQQNAVEFETYTLIALRRRLNTRKPPTESTILLAALHFVMLAFTNPDARELQRVSEGIGAMVVAYGGHAHALSTMLPSTIMSVEICDNVCTNLNGTVSLYPPKIRPLCPQSMDTVCTSTFRHPELEVRCDPQVFFVMQDMYLILSFRHPFRQKRILSTKESHYLYLLLVYNENKLGFLQAQHATAGTMTAVLVMAMVVLRQEVVPLSAQHMILTNAILRRLLAAITASLATSVDNDKLYQDVLIWACVIAMVGPRKGDIRGEFEEPMLRAIQLRYGKEKWPDNWKSELLKSLKSILWHARLEERYFQICNTFHN